MLTAKEKLIFFLPILLAAAVCLAAFLGVVLRSASGQKMLIALAVWGVLSLLLSVFTFSYLFGPDCVYCYDPPKVRLATEYLVGVVIYGIIGVALVWMARRA